MFVYFSGVNTKPVQKMKCIELPWLKLSCMYTYTIGRITGYTNSLYVEKTAVRPNKNIPTTKYIRSKSERAINKFEND